MVQVLKDLASLLLVVIVLATLSSSHYWLLLLPPVRSCFLMDNVLHFAHRPTNPLYASRLLYYPLSCFIFLLLLFAFHPSIYSMASSAMIFETRQNLKTGLATKECMKTSWTSSLAFDQKETCTSRWKSNDAKAWKKEGEEKCTSTSNGRD